MVSELCLRAGHLEVHKCSVMVVYVPGVRRSLSDSPFTLAWPGLGSDVLLLQIGKWSSQVELFQSHSWRWQWLEPGHWFSSDASGCAGHAFQKLRSLKGKLILGKKEMASVHEPSAFGIFDFITLTVC